MPVLAISGRLTQLRLLPWRVWMGQGLDETVVGASLEDLIVAARHLEDLEIFVGQRSRLHPGPGWDVVLHILRRDLAMVRAELQDRQARQPGAD